ncbi:hypothetical protein KIW84_042102 [Lathyrus oleraceus]|uniref:Protein kinase domain-containing protein n=1 Tax=Pisum sativum TaxID=3888 RepID=A0A9D5ASM6_PEA|nr:hypothetical protein KIW84_042102 [Pisum sativum]
MVSEVCKKDEEWRPRLTNRAEIGPGRRFSHLQGSKESKSILNIPKILKADKDDLIFVYGKGHLHATSSIGGEILWRKDLASDSIEVNHIVQSLEVIYVVAFVDSSTFYISIAAATDNLSLANKLGEGGFGSVYKGILSNGMAIAEKRVSKYFGRLLANSIGNITILASLFVNGNTMV